MTGVTSTTSHSIGTWYIVDLEFLMSAISRESLAPYNLLLIKLTSNFIVNKI